MPTTTNSPSEYLLDSNIFIYLVHIPSIFHHSVRNCVEMLEREGATLVYTPQNAVEFWNGCTRPVAAGGLGFGTEEVQMQMNLIRTRFRLVSDTSLVHEDRL